MILSSPFLRTRETASLIQERFGTTGTIYIENDVTEYLGWIKPEGENADVDSSTNTYITPILGVEKLDDVDSRVKRHLAKLDWNSNILVVTHGIIIKYIYNNLTNTTLRSVKELQGINVSNGVVSKLTYKEN